MGLNLGCGRAVRKGWINIDRVRSEGVDVCVDLQASGLPFRDSSVDEVYASHILEHLPRWEELLFEIHRVLKPGGLLRIRVPYGLNASAFHVRFFLPYTMDQFCSESFEGVEASSLEIRPLFKKMYQKIKRRVWFDEAFRRNFHLEIPFADDFPVGRRWEIVWVLRKVPEG